MTYTNICPPCAQVGLITGVMKAKKGSCAADTVYTVYSKTTTVNVIVIGALTIATFDKVNRLGRKKESNNLY